MSLVDLLQRFKHSTQKSPALASEILSSAVVQVIHDNRLLGEILLQLSREFRPTFNGTMGLTWQADNLILVVNPTRLAELRTDEIQLLLEHEALHVVWKHPLRYAHHRHPQMVKVATDVAVNQYLKQVPQGTVTLDQLERLLKRHIPAKLDSQDYLQLLEKLTPEEQEKLQHAGIFMEGDHHGTAAKGGTHIPQDVHDGWNGQSKSGHGKTNQQIRLANISQLLKHAWHETPQRDRGLLPGEVQQQLAQKMRPRKVAWQRILQRQIGLIAHGQQESHARFNRRQPLRMDLPGKVTRLVTAVKVFVDNSGSVSDEELSQALVTIDKMVRHERLKLDLYSFDAKVTTDQELQPGKRLQFKRRGGGGTSFQCIFDYLHDHHVARQGTLTIIITDGWGEKTIRDYHYRNICWLLMTSSDQLSVQNAPGRVLEMKGESK